MRRGIARSCSRNLDDDRVSLATAGADRGKTQTAAAPLQFQRQREDDSGAARPDRVAERYRPPLTLTRSGSAPSMRDAFRATLAKASLISNRSMSDAFRPARSSAISPAIAGVLARYGASHAASPWLRTLARNGLWLFVAHSLGRDDQRGRAVVDARSIAGRHGAGAGECGLELRQRLRAGIPSW